MSTDVLAVGKEKAILYCLVKSLGLTGIEPHVISVEVDARRGMPGFDIVGLPDAAVRESRERVRSAVQNMGYPQPNSKLVANLAPADTKKAGSVYDLPLLLALIHACGYESLDLKDTAVMGEIGLCGEVRGIPGVLPMVLDAAKLGFSRVIVPLANAQEAAVAQGVEVLAAAHANEIIDYCKGKQTLTRATPSNNASIIHAPLLDLADVKGQYEARRALEVAAAGGHNLLMIGPPGTGKSMLAKRLPSILPEMTHEEAIETTKIYSVAGELPSGISLLTQRPFRSPHHSASSAALVGGGTNPKPGDLSLAHNGVLFLDELPEFQKSCLEIMRQPLEDGCVSISRVKNRVTYPSRVMLVGAMNPCPCGNFGHPTKRCTCSPAAIRRYLGKISGPLLDRIDIHVEVAPVDYQQLSTQEKGEDSGSVRKRVCTARTMQQKRYKKHGISCNAMLTPAMLDTFCVLEPAANTMLHAAFDRLSLSARGYSRILKLARTIADLDSCEAIASSHIAQAIQMRSLDRKYWAG